MPPSDSSRPDAFSQGERAILLALRDRAEGISRLLAAASHPPRASSLDDQFVQLSKDLVAYRDARYPAPLLVQVDHLITLCSTVIATARAGSDRPDPSLASLFAPLAVALRRVARSDGESQSAVIEGDRPEATAQVFPCEVALINLRSAFNVGSIVRTMECYGGSRVHAVGYTAGLDHPKVAPIAMGCEAIVPWSRAEDPQALLADLEARGITPIALETCASSPTLDDFEFPFPCAILLGNERFGLEPEVLAACKATVRLPMYGRKNSLNVANAFAVAIHSVRRQWQAALIP